MEPFKNLLNPALVRDAAARLQSLSAHFAGQQFAALAGEGLQALELKARALHICAALEATLIDYAVHHVKADGSTSPKVFKVWTLELPAHAEVMLAKRHSLRPVTTRRYHPGRHPLTVQVNGRDVAQGEFTLRMPQAATEETGAAKRPRGAKY